MRLRTESHRTSIIGELCGEREPCMSRVRLINGSSLLALRGKGNL
jgi:hypothetical protein